MPTTRRLVYFAPDNGKTKTARLLAWCLTTDLPVSDASGCMDCIFARSQRLVFLRTYQKLHRDLASSVCRGHHSGRCLLGARSTQILGCLKSSGLTARRRGVAMDCGSVCHRKRDSRTSTRSEKGSSAKPQLEQLHAWLNPTLT